jgi:glycerophosphoryl diester phosphodiesterase
MARECDGTDDTVFGMKRGNILAHRGLWTDPADKNSRDALVAALDLGFGVETDFRDSGGMLWVSHDPVAGDGTFRAARFFEDCAGANQSGRLALNIKADGLQRMISDAIDAAGVPVERVFAFDMSVPDTLGYIRRGFPVYSRASEYETDQSFGDIAQGVWVDNFTGGFPQVHKAMALLESGQRVAMVSPELHGRPHEALWQEILQSGLHLYPGFELCTDFPEEASRILGAD